MQYRQRNNGQGTPIDGSKAERPGRHNRVQYVPSMRRNIYRVGLVFLPLSVVMVGAFLSCGLHNTGRSTVRIQNNGATTIRLIKLFREKGDGVEQCGKVCNLAPQSVETVPLKGISIRVTDIVIDDLSGSRSVPIKMYLSGEESLLIEIQPDGTVETSYIW